ncbi:glutamate--tRNA ligase family protein [Algoriphagus sediminis]|uniref:Glutamate--tRNA ligase family protein n=1 Tax=Algoriphagus sediminis TaxID=3057113 RepID=A0ABT7YAV5_9BACT|nr:glutamate--tRNA ligase family protein [Algoriphagus sediminis]MDN3203652.1 glutamate--tRNA ligase family protein [Algoriphagus sediminis]
MNSKVTRFAPTPSGYLHLGNLYSFLVTKAMANHHGAKILLRIDDMDQERVRPEYIQDIFDTLEFMDLGYDFGPKTSKELKEVWSQMNRLKKYSKAIEQLISAQKLFTCDCSRKTIKKRTPDGQYDGFCLARELPLDQPDTALRLKTDDFTSSFGRSEAFPVILKKDGFPAYHLCSLMDDLEFEVDLVIRGLDLLTSTATQEILANALNQSENFGKIKFIHHELLFDENGGKLAKSSGSRSIKHLRESGKTKSQVYTMLSSALNWKTEVDNFQDFSSEIIKKNGLP